MALYDAEAHGPNRSSAFRLGQDPGVSCTTHSALALWMLGYPARAAARMQEAFALARSLVHPFSVAYACHFAAGLHQWRGDRQAVQAVETEALAIDTEHGFGLFLTAGAIQRGWLLAEHGREEEGLAQMREGLARHRNIGAEVLAPAFLAMVAEVHEKLGRLAESLSIVSEAIAAGQRSGQHYWEGELHRLRGALTLRAGGSADDAEACFRQAIAVARSQQARSLELRGATSLSRLWAGRGKVREAHALLSDVYDWFTEGFDTADLIDAKSLLEELAGRGGGSRVRRAGRSSPAAPGAG
jgi:predicted ATPase